MCSPVVVEDKFLSNSQCCEVPPNDIFVCRDDRIEGACRIGECTPLQVRVAKSALALLQKLASLDGEGNSAPIGNLKAHLVP